MQKVHSVPLLTARRQAPKVHSVQYAQPVQGFRALPAGHFEVTERPGLKLFLADAPISRRVIHGVASTPRHSTPARKGAQVTSLNPMGCIPKSPLPIFSDHAQHRHGDSVKPIGQVSLVRLSCHKVFIRGSIFETGAAADHAWALIEKGDVRAVSVLSRERRLESIVDDVRFVSEWECLEVSVCREGANTDCKFEICEDDA